MTVILKNIKKPVLIILALSILLLTGCTSSTDEGFAIYLTSNDIDPTRMPEISRIEIAEQPVISLKDITAYNPRTHEITLTKNAYERIAGMEVPLGGKAFVVCVNKQPVYAGAFWTYISSYFFEGIIIPVPFGFEDNTVMRITLHCVDSDVNVEDPRSNPEIMKSLEQADKLSTLPLAPCEEENIGHNFKGWELYSWQEDKEWHFTLMYGTNRNKYLEEVVSIVNTKEHNHVVGLDAIKSVLNKLPENEEIFWHTWYLTPQCPAATGQSTEDTIDFSLPPEDIVNNLAEYANQHGLKLYIPN